MSLFLQEGHREKLLHYKPKLETLHEEFRVQKVNQSTVTALTISKDWKLLFINTVWSHYSHVLLWNFRIYVPRGEPWLTDASHVSPHHSPVFVFKGILNWFWGYRKANDKFVPLSSCVACWRFPPGIMQECHISTDCYSPQVDGKIHYIIKVLQEIT